jgi:hypothetical protein
MAVLPAASLAIDFINLILQVPNCQYAPYICLLVKRLLKIHGLSYEISSNLVQILRFFDL